jgi:hypothetical protein
MREVKYSLLRKTRTLLQTAMEPIDYAARLLNNKKGYPPLRLRQQVGDLKDFEGSGGEYLAYLKLLCGLKPGDKLLDIGCGCGLILLDTTGAGSLAGYLGPNGRYVGLDINEELIDWCNKKIRRKHPTCQFGPPYPKEVLFEYKFNVILAKSLFTHLLPNMAEVYLRLVWDKLAPGGKCLSTWFLLDGVKPRGKYTFRYREGIVAYERETNKELAVAYDEKWLTGLLRKLGFSIQVWYGTWRGDRRGLSFQDIIVLRRQ